MNNDHDHDNDFVWTFPCYALEKTHELSLATGAWHVEFALAGSGEQRSILLFTDADLVERYKADSGSADFKPLPLRNATELREFLKLAVQTDTTVVVDLEHRSDIGRKFQIAPLLSRLEQQGA